MWDDRTVRRQGQGVSVGTQKISLTAEKETLLVPLYSKAIENRRKRPIIDDPKAQEILDQIDYDFDELKIPKQSLVTLAMRARRLDWYVQDYLGRYDRPLVLHLGCGLDSRVLRVGCAKGTWYDLDFPEVIALRRRFYSESARYHMIASSVTDLSWLKSVGETGPACVIAEGLFMYLSEEEVKALLLGLQERLPGSEVGFDSYSVLTARSVGKHPSIKKTGANVQWGIDDAHEIEGWGVNIHLMEEWFFTNSPDVESLDLWFRLLFRIMGSFGAARRAHRLLRIHL